MVFIKMAGKSYYFITPLKITPTAIAAITITTNIKTPTGSALLY